MCLPGRRSRCRCRFNGAALRRARRSAFTSRASSRVRSFNGAALRRARRWILRQTLIRKAHASTGPRSEERGDQGLSTSPVPCSKLQRGRAPKSAEIQKPTPFRTNPRPASTGPRSEERGDLHGCLGRINEHGCFNGAALRRARRSALQGSQPCSGWRFNGAALRRARRSESKSDDGRPRPRFNGAALRRARRYRVPSPVSYRLSKLQRGRAPKSAEISLLLEDKRSTSGFNGAALRRARRFPQRIQRRPSPRASTGPRSEERGDVEDFEWASLG